MDELTKDMSEKIARIRELVMMQAQLEYGEIRREMDDYHNHKLNKYRGNFSAETAQQMEAETQEAERAADAEAARRKAELKRELYVLRQAESEKVFAQAQCKIEAFVQGADYGAFLEARAQAAAKLFGDAARTLVLRPADMKYADAVKAAAGANAVCADDHIRLGGLRLEDAQGRIADESLDTALKDEKTRFYDSCGAILSE